MPYIKQELGGFSWGLTLKEIVEALALLRRVKTPYLVYDNAFKSYTCRDLAWLSATTAQGSIVAPYTIEHDYRDADSCKGWGTVSVCNSAFKFPVELISHKDRMVRRFSEEGRLGKGDRGCPRLCDFHKDADRPVFGIQEASYFDQVGTNLSVDFPFSEELEVSGHPCSSVRVWDMKQASLAGQPPSFAASRLANTIGIAVGVTAKDGNGHPHPLKRKRSEKVAVFAGEWHVPFSFALAWKETLALGDTLALSDLIAEDWGHELAQELGLEVSDFERPRPLVFCRDMVRGGKPQFFFEMASRKSLEDLEWSVGSDESEYVGKIETADVLLKSYSPELLAFSLLTLAK